MMHGCDHAARQCVQRVRVVWQVRAGRMLKTPLAPSKRSAALDSGRVKLRFAYAMEPKSSANHIMVQILVQIGPLRTVSEGRAPNSPQRRPQLTLNNPRFVVRGVAGVASATHDVRRGRDDECGRSAPRVAPSHKPRPRPQPRRASAAVSGLGALLRHRGGHSQAFWSVGRSVGC